MGYLYLFAHVVALTFDLDHSLDFWSSVRYVDDPYACKRHDHRSVGLKDRVETNGRTRPIALLSLLTWSLITRFLSARDRGTYVTVEQSFLCS